MMMCIASDDMTHKVAALGYFSIHMSLAINSLFVWEMMMCIASDVLTHKMAALVGCFYPPESSHISSLLEWEKVMFGSSVVMTHKMAALGLFSFLVYH